MGRWRWTSEGLYFSSHSGFAIKIEYVSNLLGWGWSKKKNHSSAFLVMFPALFHLKLRHTFSSLQERLIRLPASKRYWFLKIHCWRLDVPECARVTVFFLRGAAEFVSLLADLRDPTLAAWHAPLAWRDTPLMLCHEHCREWLLINQWQRETYVPEIFAVNVRRKFCVLRRWKGMSRFIYSTKYRPNICCYIEIYMYIYIYIYVVTYTEMTRHLSQHVLLCGRDGIVENST
jgi:hypothetical protein